MKPTHLTTDDKIIRNKQVSLLELLDKLLDKGVVIKGEILLSVADIDLVYLNLGLFLSSVKTAVKTVEDAAKRDDTENVPLPFWHTPLPDEFLQPPLLDMEENESVPIKEVTQLSQPFIAGDRIVQAQEALEIPQPSAEENELLQIKETIEIHVLADAKSEVVLIDESSEIPLLVDAKSEVVLVDEVSQMLQLATGKSEVILAGEIAETPQPVASKSEVIFVEEISQVLQCAATENKNEEASERPLSPGVQPKAHINPENVEKGLTKLVLTVVDLLRKLMEKQAIQRIEAGQVNSQEIERVADTFFLLDQKMEQLKEIFGLQNEELNLDLGPLGDLI